MSLYAKVFFQVDIFFVWEGAGLDTRIRMILMTNATTSHCSLHDGTAL